MTQQIDDKAKAISEANDEKCVDGGQILRDEDKQESTEKAEADRF